MVPVQVEGVIEPPPVGEVETPVRSIAEAGARLRKKMMRIRSGVNLYTPML